MTLGRLLEAGAAYLCRHGFDGAEARCQSGILIAEATGVPVLRLATAGDRAATAAQVERLRQEFRRVASGEPIQYVVGHWPFHDIELKTDARALIPRPETEELVGLVLRSPQWAQARDIADIGTGTGAIVLALAHAARGTPKSFTAVDLSPEALALARENAAALDLRVRFLEGEGCAPLAPGSTDILVSNPPYIASRTVDTLDPRVRDHEPRLALDGGEDGLDAVRSILLGATQVLRPGGRIFFEIGDEQGLSVQRLLERAGYTDVGLGRDAAGHDRFAWGTLL